MMVSNSEMSDFSVKQGRIWPRAWCDGMAGPTSPEGFTGVHKDLRRDILVVNPSRKPVENAARREKGHFWIDID